MKELPEGYMYMGQYVVRIKDVEDDCRQILSYFDYFGRGSYQHWRNDPSYHWATETKLRKERTMPMHVYSDDCADCRPAVRNMTTGEVLPDDHPLMQRILAAWAKTTPEQRRAWHAVTCLNSRKLEDMELAQSFVKAIENPV